MTRHIPIDWARRRSLILAGGGMAAMLGLPARHAVAQAVDLSKVTLRVGDQTGVSQGLLKAAGLLNELPYKIEWSQFPAAVNLHEALKANATDIGSANDSPTVSAIAGGSKISVVAGWTNGGLGTSLLVPKNSKVNSLADLRGKTICPTTRGSVAHFLVVGLLKEAGIGLDEVKFAFLSPTDATAAFGSGNIDAWATWGIFRARAVGKLGARVLDRGERINSGLTLLSATPSAVRDPAKLAAIRHYAGLVDSGFEWGRSHRDAYIDWYASFSKQDKEVVASVYEENVANRRARIDAALIARIKATHAVWVENAILTGSIDFSQRVLREERA